MTDLNLLSLAKPYIETAKPGDTLRVDTCPNPAGWWSVFRNDRPIHHFPDKDVAEKLAYLIANADFGGKIG